MNEQMEIKDRAGVNVLSTRTPRPARLTSGAQATRGSLVTLLIGGICLLCWLAHLDLSDLTALKAHGQTIQAHINAKRESHGKSTSYYLDYSFETERQDVRGTESVTQSVYSGTTPGDRLTATYLPGSPQTYRVGLVNQGRIESQQTKWVGGILVFAMVVGLLLLGIESDFHRQLRLLRDGAAVEGAITVSKPVRSGSPSSGSSVTYKFRIPFGKELTNTVTLAATQSSGLDVGSSLVVLYDPENPCSNRPYLALAGVELEPV